jgi:hypothetical protein
MAEHDVKRGSRRKAQVLCLLILSWVAVARAQDLESSDPFFQNLAPLPESDEVASADVDPAAELSTNTLASTSRDQPLVKISKADDLWAFQFGVSIISDNTLRDYFNGNFKRLFGPGGGLTYNLEIARRLKRYDWTIGQVHLHPEWEMPFRLTLVGDRVQGVIPDVNLGFRFRWRDFPWNRYLATTMAVGGGLSYTFEVWTGDFQRHPGQERSQWKFWLPMELTMALPQWPRYQLTAFIDHRSGGRIFDRGGIDTWGFGFRVVF